MVSIIHGAEVGAQARDVELIPEGATDLRHRSWSIEDGAPPDIWALSQTADGYLWLGTGADLFRFDGVGFQEVLPSGGPMPSRNITALATAPNGDLWIGYYTGQVSRLRHGRLETFADADVGGTVQQILIDRAGDVWVARLYTARGLTRFRAGRWNDVGGRKGLPAGEVYGLAMTRSQRMVAVFADGTYLSTGRGDVFERLGPGGIGTRVAASRDGLVAATTAAAGFREDRGVRTRVLGRLARRPKRMLVDRDGMIWLTLDNAGVRRLTPVHGGKWQSEEWTTRRGLSSNASVAVFQEFEGSVWVGSNLWLDRFRSSEIHVVVHPATNCECRYERADGPDGATYLVDGSRRAKRIGAALSFLNVETGGFSIIVRVPRRAADPSWRPRRGYFPGIVAWFRRRGRMSEDRA